MEMVFQGLPLQHKEHQAGCIGGLFSLFDVRHGRSSTRTLLVEASGARDSSPEPNLAEVCESVSKMDDNYMLDEHVLRNLADCSAVDPEKIDPEYEHNPLFFKLQQERTSLRVKDITNSENEDSSQQKPTESKSDKLSRRRHRHRMFFNVALNSSNEDHLSPTNGVVLKPRPVEVEIERSARQFSFNNIKKKLRLGILQGKNHLYSAKPSSNTDRGKVEDRGSPMVTETSRCANFEERGMYSEAKRHLSKMLKSGASKDKQMSVKLGTILSFPEDNDFSCSSPSKHGDGILTTNESFQDGDDYHPIQTMECPLERQPFTDKAPQAHDSDPSLGEVEIQEKIETAPEEDEKAADSCSGSFVFVYSINSCSNEETAAQCLDDSSSLLLSQSPTLSPTSIKNMETEDVTDHMDRFSPVSVLQPLLDDDNKNNNVDISPSSFISQPVDKQFQRIKSELWLDYIEAVLLASGLDWESILLRWISLHDILDPMLFDEVELLSSESHDQKKLVFDCASDALEDICEGYFRSMAGGASQGMMMMLQGHLDGTGTTGTDLIIIDEIWERVRAILALQNQNSESCSWEDLAVAETDNNGGKWMNLEVELQLVCSEIEEVIFHDMVEDALITHHLLI